MNPAWSGPFYATVRRGSTVAWRRLPGQGGPSGGPALGRDQVPVPGERRPRRALLGREVHVREAEPLCVAFAPFEIVHQRPGEVPAHVHPGGHRVVYRPDVAIQVPDPGLVVDDAVGGQLVIDRTAVLGDVDRRGGG